MLEINTRDLSTRRKALIDGHEYVVRRLGAGDELAVSQMSRRAQELLKIAKESKDGNLTPELQKELDDLSERSLKIYASTYDDGGDGSRSLALVKSLSIAERVIMHNTIFVEPTLNDVIDNEVDHGKATDEAVEEAEEPTTEDDSAEPAAS
jgi:hypothetical protein